MNINKLLTIGNNYLSNTIKKNSFLHPMLNSYLPSMTISSIQKNPKHIDGKSFIERSCV